MPKYSSNRAYRNKYPDLQALANKLAGGDMTPRVILPPRAYLVSDRSDMASRMTAAQNLRAAVEYYRFRRGAYPTHVSMDATTRAEIETAEIGIENLTIETNERAPRLWFCMWTEQNSENGEAKR